MTLSQSLNITSSNPTGCLTVEFVSVASGSNFGAEEEIEEIVIVGDQLFQDTTDVSPTSFITAEDLTAIHMSTVEDALMYEPNLIIRRRFIGDPNGVIGMRGSNTSELIFENCEVPYENVPVLLHIEFKGNKGLLKITR